MKVKHIILKKQFFEAYDQFMQRVSEAATDIGASSVISITTAGEVGHLATIFYRSEL